MKKSIIAALGLSLSLALSGAANAAATSNKAKIDRVEVTDDWFAIYPAVGDFGNKEGCTSADVIPITLIL